MKPGTIAALGAMLVLAGCGSSDEGKSGGEAAPETAAPETADAAAPAPDEGAAPADAGTSTAAAPAAGEKPPRDFVVGNWGTNGDCSRTMDLRADGTSDGPFGNWAYADGAISFPDFPEAKISVTVVDDKTMESDSGSGGKKKMTRC